MDILRVLSLMIGDHGLNALGIVTLTVRDRYPIVECTDDIEFAAASLVCRSQRPTLAHPEPPVALGELFKIGIGPSSSHTVGPMKAAGLFLQHLTGRLGDVQRLVATLYGSLAWTGKGHATDKALMLGLSGETADTIDPDLVEQKLSAMLASRTLTHCRAAGRSASMQPPISCSIRYRTSRVIRMR
jgi:hypothetical protein